MKQCICSYYLVSTFRVVFEGRWSLFLNFLICFCRWSPLAHSLLDITNLVIVSLYGLCIVQQVKWNANKLNTKISLFTTSDLIKPIIAFPIASSFSGKIYCYSSWQQFIHIFLFPIHCRIKNVRSPIICNPDIWIYSIARFTKTFDVFSNS